MQSGFGLRARRCAVLIAICAVALAGQARATDYYVDATTGLDTDAGTTPEAAWKSLTKVSAFAFAAGDRVLFKRGEIWRGLLRVTKSGTAASPITFGAYGSGDLPTINGSQSVTAWSDAGTNLYKATISTRVEQVFFDGVRGTQQASVAALDVPGEWHWASNVLTVYSATVPGLVEASADQFSVLFNNVLHVRMENLRIIRGLYPVWLLNTANISLFGLTVEDGAGYAGIFVTPIGAGRGSNTLIQKCLVTGMVGNSASRANGNDGSGIEIYGNGIGANNSIIENIVHDNKHEGILLAESSGNLVRGNIVYNHGESGIRAGLPSTSNNIIEYNTVFANAQFVDDRFGIDLIYVGNNNTVRYNTVYSQSTIPGGLYLSGGIRFDGNDGSGNVLTESTGNTAYYNLVYDEFIGINVFSFSNVSLYNNTIVGSKQFGIAANAPTGVTPVNTIIRNNIVAPATGSVLAHVNLANSQINHNCYFFGPGATFIWGFQFLTYAAYLAQSGQDVNSIAANPLFLDATARDYRIQALSPARDAGVDVGLSLARDGVLVPQDAAPDIGAYEYIFVAPPEGEGIVDGEGVLEGEGVVDGEGVVEGVVEGIVEGVIEGEGVLEGEGVIEGEGVLEGEGMLEGEGVVDGEGVVEGEGVAEGVVEGNVEGIQEGVVEGVSEGFGEGIAEGEGQVEGVAEGEGAPVEGEGDPNIDKEFDFTASATEGPAPLPVQFTASARKVDKAQFPLWAWDFGDGNFDSGLNVSHVYDEPGVYTVTLSVITGSGIDTVIKPEYIEVATTIPAANVPMRALLVFALTGLALASIYRKRDLHR